MEKNKVPVDEEELDALLNKLYYDVKGGYLAADKFHKRLASLGYKIPLTTIKKWLGSQPAFTDTVKPRKPLVFNSVWVDYVGANYQMDTMFMRNYAYNGYNYILLVIDIHSRYLAALPLRTKKSEEYTAAFRTMVKNQLDNIWPESLDTDSEYVSDQFAKLLDKKDVKFKLSERGQPYKNAVIERVIRTIRGMIGRWRAGDPYGGGDWPSALPDLVENYNNTYHRTIKQTPKNVWLQKEPNNQVIRYVRNLMGVGDYVRYLVRDKNKRWSKVDDMVWSKDVYQIEEAIGSRWKLKPLNGKPNLNPDSLYMEYELKLVPRGEVPRASAAGVIVQAQRDNNAAARRLRKEDIGELTEDVGGRPVFAQLVLREPRQRKQTQRDSHLKEAATQPQRGEKRKRTKEEEKALWGRFIRKQREEQKRKKK